MHRRHSDVFYVLEGELTVALGPDRAETIAPVGTLLLAPPLVVHAFRNGSAADVRYLNFHAPGAGFADYIRGLRDGRPVAYDQEPPPAEGVRPASEAVIGEPGLGVHVDIDAIRIAEVRSAPGDAPPPRTEGESFYVLEGELVLALGDRELRARTGSWVEMPAGVPHVLTSQDPVRYLSVLTGAAGA